VIAGVGAVALLVAALWPPDLPRAALVRRGLAVVGSLSLLPAAGSSGTWPFVLLAGAAAVTAAPLALILAAAGAVVVVLRPEASAPVALGGAALATAAAASGLQASIRAGGTPGPRTSAPALVGGLLLAAALATVGGGAVLSWTFSVGGGDDRTLLGGVGVALGVALVAALGGVLLLGGATLAPPAPGPRQAGLGALATAAVLTGCGIGLALLRLASLPEGLRAAGARPLALLVGAAGILAVLLTESTDPPAEAAGSHLGLSPHRLFQVAAALALAAAVAAGMESWWRDGTYATSLTTTSSVAALLGLAALEPVPRFQEGARVLFLVVLVSLLLA
jgi:hypothetical protein